MKITWSKNQTLVICMWSIILLCIFVLSAASLSLSSMQFMAVILSLMAVVLGGSIWMSLWESFMKECSVSAKVSAVWTTAFMSGTFLIATLLNFFGDWLLFFSTLLIIGFHMFYSLISFSIKLWKEKTTVA